MIVGHGTVELRGRMRIGIDKLFGWVFRDGVTSQIRFQIQLRL